MRLVWCTIRTLLIVLNNLYCIPTYVCWLIILSPLESFNPQLYHEIEGVLFHWLLSMVALWSYSAGYNGESRILNYFIDLVISSRCGLSVMIIVNMVTSVRNYFDLSNHAWCI